MNPSRPIPYPAAVPAYHDLMPLAGVPGVVATWTGPDGRARAAFVSGTLVRGHSFGTVAMPDGRDAAEDLATALAPWTSAVAPEGMAMPLPEGAHMLTSVLDAAFPGPVAVRELGVPSAPRTARRDAARAAVRALPMPEPLRGALHAAIDHGPHPGLASVLHLRNGRRDPLWGCVRFVLEHPCLSRALAEDAADVPLAADLVERLVSAKGIKPSHLRRLRVDAPSPPLRDITDEGLATLAHVPPEWLPADAPGWDAFEAVAMMCDKATEGSDRERLSLARASRGDWDGYLDRCAAAFMPGMPEGRLADWEDLATAAQSVHDLVLALADDVLAPTLAHVSGWTPPAAIAGPGDLADALADADASDALSMAAADAALRMVVGDGSLPSAVALARAWHDNFAAYDVRTAEEALEWPPLFHGVMAMADIGIAVVCVHDSVSVREEGAAGPDRKGRDGLDHCVASRIGTLASGHSHLLSVQGFDGTRIATAQVAHFVNEAGKPSLAIEECRGLRNGRPAPLAMEALSRLDRLLSSGAIVANPDALARREPLHEDEIADACGYDWRDAGARANAARVWTRLLPRWARGLADEALVDAMVANGALDGDASVLGPPGAARARRQA